MEDSYLTQRHLEVYRGRTSIPDWAKFYSATEEVDWANRNVRKHPLT